MLGPGESRPRRRIVEVVMMLVLHDPACAAAESGLIPVHITWRMRHALDGEVQSSAYIRKAISGFKFIHVSCVKPHLEGVGRPAQ